MTAPVRGQVRAGRSLALVAAVAAALCAFAIALAPPAYRAAAEGKSADKPAKLKKNQAWVAPDFAAYGVKVIAFAPVSSVDRNPESEKLVRQALEPGFAPLKYRFLSQSATMDLVRRAHVEKAMTDLHAAYLSGAPLDTALTHMIANHVSADALMFSHVSQWQRFIVDPGTRGQSFTQIGVELALYSLRSGAPLWRGNFLEKGDGPYNDPSVNEAPERDPGGNATGRNGLLEPPPFAEVLEKLAERAVKTLPPPPAPTPAPARSSSAG